jgi:hypothetical protein
MSWAHALPCFRPARYRLIRSRPCARIISQLVSIMRIYTGAVQGSRQYRIISDRIAGREYVVQVPQMSC